MCKVVIWKVQIQLQSKVFNFTIAMQGRQTSMYLMLALIYLHHFSGMLATLHIFFPFYVLLYSDISQVNKWNYYENISKCSLLMKPMSLGFPLNKIHIAACPWCYLHYTLVNISCLTMSSSIYQHTFIKPMVIHMIHPRSYHNSVNHLV